MGETDCRQAPPRVRSGRRAVYLFDEFDVLGADRSGNDVGEARRILTAMTYSLPDACQAVAVIKARPGSLAAGPSMAKLGEYTDCLSHADLVKAAESAAKSVLTRGESKVERDDIAIALNARRTASLG